MENQEKLQASAKRNSEETKIVAIVLHPNGSAQVRSFVREQPLPGDFTLNGSVIVNSKDFESLPKRLAFFFEKNFKI